MVDVFEIPREDVDAFIVGWRRRAAFMATQPGFRSAELLEAAAEDTRFQLINVARWDSEEAWHAAFAHPTMASARNEVDHDPGQRVVGSTGLYRTTATLAEASQAQPKDPR